MKRKGLLLAAVLTLALWLGVGTAFAGGGLPLLGGGGQDNTAIVVQNIASGNTIQGIGNEAGSNGAVAAANVDQTNVGETAASNPGRPDGCLCDRIDGPQGPDQSRPAEQQNDAVAVQNVASGNTVQGAFNDQGRDGTQDGCGCDEHPQEGGQNGAVAVANVDQTNVDRQSGDEQRCGSCGGSDSSGDSSADQSNGAVVVQNVASGNTIQGAFNRAGSNGAVAVAGVDQQNAASSQGGDSRWSKDDKDGRGSVDQSNRALAVQNVASGNTIQLIGNKAGSNRAVAVAGVEQTNAASSQGEGGGSDVDQSNRALVVQNVASGNTIQGAFNRSGSNAAFAVAAVDQKNVSSDGRTSYSREDVTKGCGSCSQHSHPTPHPLEHHPCPPPEHHPCPPPKHHPCPAPEHHPCPPKPCPGAPGVPEGAGPGVI